MNILKMNQVRVHRANHPLAGTVEVPGSKSLTNRALLLAALAKGRSTLTNVLFSDDTRYMIAALREMGVSIDQTDATTLVVEGRGELAAPERPLFLGNAGTATRFLTAAAVLARGQVVVDGDEHMRKRPIEPLVTALRSLGVTVTTETGCPPVVIEANGGFTGNRVQIDASLSSQYVSALLMLAACGQQPVDVVMNSSNIGGRGYIDLTLSLMKMFGAKVAPIDDIGWRIEPTGYAAHDYVVEPDASSSTYVWAAEALTQGSINIQSDSDAMTQPDAKVRELIRQFPRLPETIDGSQFQDAVPTLAVMAAFNEHPVRFVGIENLRVKECDRIKALADGLNRIKAGLATEIGDDLLVEADPSLRGQSISAVIDSYADHRIAMCFTLAGLLVDGIVIDNPGCVAKTFPSYWDMMSSLGVGFSAP